jgi:hypothetical protein
MKRVKVFFSYMVFTNRTRFWGGSACRLTRDTSEHSLC